MTATTTHPADVLTWGHGPRTLEVFLELTCPFSGRAFGKFDELMARAGEDRLTLKIRLLPQPWHTFSPVTALIAIVGRPKRSICCSTVGHTACASGRSSLLSTTTCGLSAIAGLNRLSSWLMASKSPSGSGLAPLSR